MSDYYSTQTKGYTYGWARYPNRTKTEIAAFETCSEGIPEGYKCKMPICTLEAYATTKPQ